MDVRDQARRSWREHGCKVFAHEQREAYLDGYVAGVVWAERSELDRSIKLSELAEARAAEAMQDDIGFDSDREYDRREDDAQRAKDMRAAR